MHVRYGMPVGQRLKLQDMQQTETDMQAAIRMHSAYNRTVPISIYMYMAPQPVANRLEQIFRKHATESYMHVKDVSVLLIASIPTDLEVQNIDYKFSDGTTSLTNYSLDEHRFTTDLLGDTNRQFQPFTACEYFI